MFYAAASSTFFISSDGGKTFTETKASLSGDAVNIAVNLETAGDVWVATNNGVYHTTDFGGNFEVVPGITQVRPPPFFYTLPP